LNQERNGVALHFSCSQEDPKKRNKLRKVVKGRKGREGLGIDEGRLNQRTR